MTVPATVDGGVEAQTAAPSAKRRGWQRCIVISVVLLALLWVARAPLLRLVPVLLIAGTSEAEVDVLIVIDGAASYYEVARRLERFPRATAWLFDRRPNRLQRRGLLPPSRDCARQACAAAGIAADRVQEQTEQIAGLRGLLDQLDRRLRDQPTLRIGLVCDEWHSRRLAGKIGSRISAAHRDRMALIPVGDAAVSRITWWHTKSSRRRVAEAALKLVADWIIVDRDTAVDEMTDDELRLAAVGPRA